MTTLGKSSTKLLLLHVWPGAMLLLLFVLLAPQAGSYGLPVYLVIFPSSLVVSALQIWFLVRESRAQKKSLKEILGYQKKISFYKYILYVPLLLVLAIIFAAGIAAAFETSLAKWFYSVVPSWLNVAQLEGFSRSSILLIIVCQLLVVSLVNPIVEELYFRGYLLKQMERMNHFGVPVHSFLFSFQHFLQPYGFLSRFLIFLPVAYVVRREQNLYIGMIWHCLLNALTTLSLIQYL